MQCFVKRHLVLLGTNINPLFHGYFLWFTTVPTEKQRYGFTTWLKPLLIIVQLVDVS